MTEISARELLDDLRRVADELGKPPTVSEYLEKGNHAYGTFKSQFGSWTAAKDEAGIDSRQAVADSRYGDQIPDDDLLNDIQRVADELDHPPIASEYKDRGEYSHTTLSKRFGSWTAAKDEAGIDPRHGHEIPEDDLISDLQRVANKLGHSPSRAEYRNHGSHSSTALRNRFGSWNNVKKRAGLETVEYGQVRFSDEELLDDLKRVADKLGHSPSVLEYQNKGSYSFKTLEIRFGSWNNAKEEVGLEVDLGKLPDGELLIEDLQRVADKIDKPPSISEYDAHGNLSVRPVYRLFGGWNEALNAAGLGYKNSHGLTDEDFLRHIQGRWEQGEFGSQDEFFNDGIEFSKTSCQTRFGSSWRALVRAGIKPPVAPLSEENYGRYIETAMNANNPYLSLMGLLRAFTGLPLPTLTYLDLSWVSRLNDDYQPPLLTVPSEYIAADEDWVMILPTHYTIEDEQKPTHLESLLSWMKDIEEIVQSKRKYIDEIIDRAELDVGPASLRASVGGHLARRGVSRGKIEMQFGGDKTDWWLSVEDFYLYLYQFEDYCHPGYEPSGIYLDPDSGDVTEIESGAN